MYYDLMQNLLGLVKKFEQETEKSNTDVHLFAQWLVKQEVSEPKSDEFIWQGRAEGRSPDSVINTSIVHLYRYAKLYAKSAIVDTSFSTPDDFIYLISLVSLGSMTKSALIRLNVHEKSAGMQVVNRLIKSDLVVQSKLENNRKSQLISITEKGKELLSQNMQNIKTASARVAEPLSHLEKIDLIRLLSKLEIHHDEKLSKNLNVVLD
ncbi:DNA-binding MarR family transcriptional regulator [Pedobacter sp. UYEF25]